MKVLIQRVKNADVKVNGEITGEISKGVLVFLGVNHGDGESEIKYLADKIVNLRIFENADKPMDLSVLDIKGELLIVSQFTLCGSTAKGRRPDFTEAAEPEIANKLYEKFIEECKKTGLKVESGKFGAMMNVSLINDGPVTLLIESK